MPRDWGKFPLQRNLGDAFADVLRRVFPRHTAKELASELGIDPATATSARKAGVGGAAMTRSLHHRQAKHDDHWDLWDAIGALIFGETRDQYDERKLAALIERTEHVRTLTEERRRRREARRENPPFDLDMEHRSFGQ